MDFITFFEPYLIILMSVQLERIYNVSMFVNILQSHLSYKGHIIFA